MSKYVKAEYLKEIADKVYTREARNAPTFEHEVLNRAVYDVLLTILGAAPAEDVTPIKRSKWLTWEEKFPEKKVPKKSNLGVFCAVCGLHADNSFMYCPSCGAKMENGITY